MTARAEASTPKAASERYAGVQPWWRSTVASGIALSSWPVWPIMPVSWVTRGTRRAGNQALTSRSTLTNVIASPAPTSTRARMARLSWWDSASMTCPVAMTSAPVAMSRRGPSRSTETPTGICSPAYTSSCSTANVARMLAEAPNRWAAAMPATPSDVRCSTATTYAPSAADHTSQALLDVTAARTAPSSQRLSTPLSARATAPRAGSRPAPEAPATDDRLIRSSEEGR